MLFVTGGRKYLRLGGQGNAGVGESEGGGLWGAKTG